MEEGKLMSVKKAYGRISVEVHRGSVTIGKETEMILSMPTIPHEHWENFCRATVWASEQIEEIKEGKRDVLLESEPKKRRFGWF